MGSRVVRIFDSEGHASDSEETHQEAFNATAKRILWRGHILTVFSD